MCLSPWWSWHNMWVLLITFEEAHQKHMAWPYLVNRVCLIQMSRLELWEKCMKNYSSLARRIWTTDLRISDMSNQLQSSALPAELSRVDRKSAVKTCTKFRMDRMSTCWIVSSVKIGSRHFNHLICSCIKMPLISLALACVGFELPTPEFEIQRATYYTKVTSQKWVK